MADATIGSFFSMVGAPANDSAFSLEWFSRSLERHLFPNGSRVKIQVEAFLDLFFEAVPHFKYFVWVSELSTKAASAEASSGTL